MLLNHARKTPGDWDDAIPSLCPDCGAVLLARRGRIVTWHWAHRAANLVSPAGGCTAEETGWHLAWKAVYHRFPGWEVEVPLELNGKRYRLDAANLSRSRVREFVHSLSESYILKHLALSGSGLDVLWIFDGETFGAARARWIRGGGVKHPLKPKARWLQSQVGGLIHQEGQLWKEWKADCWYPLERGRAAELAEAFGKVSAVLT